MEIKEHTYDGDNIHLYIETLGKHTTETVLSLDRGLESGAYNLILTTNTMRSLHQALGDVLAHVDSTPPIHT
jgi:hypothetical protein